MRVALVALLLLTAISPSLLAQDVDGGLIGRVIDADGAPLTGTSITVRGPAMQGARATVTEARGNFRFAALPVGVYIVELVHIGQRRKQITDVRVRLGRATTLGDIVLETQPVDLPALEVRAGRPFIDPTSTVVGAGLDSDQFASLPSERDYRSLVAQLPQANASSFGDETNVMGSTGLENMYYIDGVNVTDPYMYCQLCLDSKGAGTNLPWNFIQAIELKQGGYEAQYGEGLGGNVNVITHSGSNEFSFGGFGYFSSGSLAGDYKAGLADLERTDFTSWDIGLSASGPIVRDRLWFLAAYNPKFDDRDLVVPGFGPYPDRTTTHQFAGKLDWQVSERSDLTLTVFGDPTTFDAVSATFVPPIVSYTSVENPDPFLGKVSLGGTTVSLSSRWLPTDRLLLEGTAYWHRRTETIAGGTDVADTESLFWDLRTGVISGGITSIGEHRSTRAGIRVSGTVFASDHTVKAGLEYQDNTADIRDSWKEQGMLWRLADSYYLGLIYEVDALAHNRVPTVYLQDSWAISNRWRLNAGVRWEGQYLVGPAGDVNQSITDQWQPRIGLIFQPGSVGTQKLFGSVARYYQQFPLAIFGTSYGGLENSIVYYLADPRQYPDSIDYVEEFVSPDDVYPEIADLQGEHVDELVLGYERSLGQHLFLTARGVYRTLRAAFGTGVDANDEFVLGNYGRGALDFLPEADRTYRALELTGSWRSPDFSASASYVLSRSEGNYTGQYDSDAGVTNPGNNLSLQLPAQGTNSKGRLPNDRRHVFRLSGSYRFAFGLEAGTFFLWQSGTPLNEFGSSGFFRPIFLVERGSAATSPAVWDLNFRFSYDLSRLVRSLGRSRVVLDVLHLGSEQEVVWVEQAAYLGVDSEDPDIHLRSYEEIVSVQSLPNPNFGEALRYQPPVEVRLGLEFSF